MTMHKIKKCKPSNKAILSKLERDSTFAQQDITEEHSIDYENTEIFQLGFRTSSERMRRL